MRFSLRSLASLALLATLVGCGGGGRDDLPRHAVSGSVILDGQPLASGAIDFEPVDISAGQPASGSIADGSYRIERDAGPTPGNYIVRITQVDASATISAAEAMERGAETGTEAPRSAIPARYNAQSELRVDVTEAGPNTFDFALSGS